MAMEQSTPPRAAIFVRCRRAPQLASPVKMSSLVPFPSPAISRCLISLSPPTSLSLQTMNRSSAMEGRRREHHQGPPRPPDLAPPLHVRPPFDCPDLPCLPPAAWPRLCFLCSSRSSSWLRVHASGCHLVRGLAGMDLPGHATPGHGLVASGRRTPRQEFRTDPECKDSFNNAPFVYFMDSFFFQAGSQLQVQVMRRFVVRAMFV